MMSPPGYSGLLHVSSTQELLSVSIVTVADPHRGAGNIILH